MSLSNDIARMLMEMLEQDGTTEIQREIVQLYIRDMVASVAQAPILLKSFQRIALKKGESQTITFHLTSKELSMYNAALEEVVEPGDFKVMIGAASNDIKLEGIFSL